MTARQVDALLDERARLVAKNVATQGHVWVAEALLINARKLLLNMIAETTAQGIHRDNLCNEIHEFLAEDFRPHHSPNDVA